VTPRTAVKSAECLFGQEISRIRKNRGISQEELGFQAGVHRTYVSQVERGLKSPTLAVILKLTLALNCSAGRLVGKIEGNLKN
jgi:transcriptional regulator with XRE-family HTH domain